jgi:hypothetical protein
MVMAQRPVTLADIVAGHVSLEIEGFDRIYLNGYVPAMQTSGQVASFLHSRGFPIASPAGLGQNAQAFRAAVHRYAQDNGIPWVKFTKGGRKLDVIRPYLGRRGEGRAVQGGGDRGGAGVPVGLRRDADGGPGRGAMVPVLPDRAAGDLLLLLHP